MVHEIQAYASFKCTFLNNIIFHRCVPVGRTPPAGTWSSGGEGPSVWQDGWCQQCAASRIRPLVCQSCKDNPVSHSRCICTWAWRRSEIHYSHVRLLQDGFHGFDLLEVARHVSGQHHLHHQSPQLSERVRIAHLNYRLGSQWTSMFPWEWIENPKPGCSLMFQWISFVKYQPLTAKAIIWGSTRSLLCRPQPKIFMSPLTSSHLWTDSRGCSFHRRSAVGDKQSWCGGSPEQLGHCTTWLSLTCKIPHSHISSQGRAMKNRRLTMIEWEEITWSECGSYWWFLCVHSRGWQLQRLWQRSPALSASAEGKRQRERERVGVIGVIIVHWCQINTRLTTMPVLRSR